MATLKKTTNWFSRPILLLNAGLKHCRLLQREHSAILFTFIELPLSLRSVFCLFLSGRFTQELLYNECSTHDRVYNIVYIGNYKEHKSHCKHYLHLTSIKKNCSKTYPTPSKSYTVFSLIKALCTYFFFKILYPF